MENLQFLFVTKILLFDHKILSNNKVGIVINKTEETTKRVFYKNNVVGV